MIIYEGKINTEDRNKLPDSAFGIPSKRKYPLTDKNGNLDKDHILQAVRFFNKADEADKPILAKNIIAAAKKLDMDYSKWETVLKYAKEEAIKEAFSNDKWNLGWYRPVSLKCIETMRNKHVRWDYGQGLNDIYPNIDSSCRGTIFVDEQMTPVAYYVIRENIFGESYLLASAVCKNFQDHGVEEQLKYLINEYMNEDWTIEDAKKIASRIHDKVQADSKPPTGNQNCQLCTWCAEANFRGIDVLPRPIYSPRDPALEIVGETIIKNPVRKSLKSGFDDWLDLLAESGPKARWYCHVNWKGSEGGHEFLILVDGDKKWIMDPQQGFVEKFLETSSYVSDVNYDNSYICRLDTGEFNKELFDKWNDESTIVPWDPALDIPYMKENGMLSDEDVGMLESKDVFTSGDFAKYGDGVDLNAARGPIQQEAVHTDKYEKIPVKDKSFDKLYFGSPKKYGNCIELNGPLFVSPYIGIASIFVWKDMEIQNHVPKGSYNLQYEEWMHASEDELNKPFKDVHVYVEGYPELEPYEIENTGYIHVIDGHEYGDKLCRYKWMADDLEYLIDDTAAQNEVHVSKVIKCTVRYHISGKATNNPKLGPYKNTIQESKTNIPMKKVSILYKRWCVDNREQYEKIARFWDIVEQYVNCDYLQGYGTAWTSDNGGYFTYGIIFKKGSIQKDLISAVKKEFPDMNVSNSYSVPSKYDHTFNGKTKDIDTLYDKIWSKGPLAYELEEFRSDGTCSIHVIYKADVIQESATELPMGVYLRPATEEDLINIIQWKLESVSSHIKDDPKVISYIKKDAAENLKDTKMIMSGARTIGVLESCAIDDGEWWYIGEIYLIPEYRGKGIARNILQQEIDSHDKLKLRVAKENTHAIDLYKSLGFVVSEEDQFSYIMTLVKQPVQEGAWGDIRNGVNPWSKKKVFHISPQGHLDGQVFKPRVPEYLDKYDPSLPDFEDASTPRICFSPSIEGCLNAIMVNIGRWKTADKLRDWYVYVPEKPLNAYKYRTNKQLIKEKKVYDANLTKEIWIEEPVRMKQYGIIRIDSVSDKTRKNAVPSTKGESKRRNVYNFKWHWLVKPKVLKDVAYDYSPMGVCKNMVDELYGFKWGLAENGSVRNASPQEFDTKYHLQSPEEFEKNHGGICYDFVEWEAGYLEAYGYTCRKFYIYAETPAHDTHTFILVDDGKGGFIYPEGAFKLMEGIYEVKSPEEAALKIMDKIFEVSDANKKLKEIKYYVWEYKGHPPYGSDMDACQRYFTQHDPFHEGTAAKIK